jgi:purine-nucleoside phosphorylase
MTPATQYGRAVQAADFIRSRAKELPRVALVLGSGLGAFADELDEAVAIPYEEIPCFPVSTVEGHAGRLVLGQVNGVPVAAMQGRFHYYEGYALDEVTLPMRVFHLLGVTSAVITNAAGGLNSDFLPGTLMVISDHLNPTGLSPLRGANDERFGPRFPDMTEVYCRKYQELAIDAAQFIKLDLRRGVYCLLPGPHYETPAEIRMYRTMGADAVGMSTVPEAIVARHMGINILGISCITNLAAGMLDQPINHEEVMEIGARVGEKFKELLRRVIPHLSVVSGQ